MRIGIDCRIIDKWPSGMGRYAVNLVQHLARMDLENEYIIFTNHSDSISKFIVGAENFRLRLLRSSTFSVWEQVELPVAIRKEGLDIFHSLSFCMSIIQPCLSIMTIYDLIHLLFPRNYSRSLSLYYKTIVAHCVRKVDRIMTVSYSSKRDIVNLLNVPEDKISVIYGAPDEQFKPTGDIYIRNRLDKIYGISKPYVLYVGNMRPHKNLMGLLKAFYRCRQKGLDFMLVICGERMYSYRELYRRAVGLDMEKEVVFTGVVPDEDLVMLYNGAGALVLPSLYEGFGLPPLEAMVCGTPVIASRTASLSEVLRDVAILFDPGNISELAGAIEEVLINDGLRERLCRKGLERTRMFSWSDTAKRALSMYSQVFNNP